MNTPLFQEQIRALQGSIEICELHARRIAEGLQLFRPPLPLTAETIETLSVEDLSHLEFMTGRFAKLQDYMGAKLFPLILEVLGQKETWQTFIDRLNHLERLGLFPSADVWRDMGEVRNKLNHEYPDQPQITADALNTAMAYTKDLLTYWYDFKPKVKAIMAQVTEANVQNSRERFDKNA